jgi:hypothetical protein
MSPMTARTTLAAMSCLLVPAACAESVPTAGNDAGADTGTTAGADACAAGTRPSPASLAPASYDHTCRSAADCFAVSVAPLTCPGECVACPSAAVSAVGADAVRADIALATAGCAPESCVGQLACAPCPSPVVACVGGACALCTGGACADAGADAASDAARD